MLMLVLAAKVVPAAKLVLLRLAAAAVLVANVHPAILSMLHPVPR